MIRPIQSAIIAISILLAASLFAPSARNLMAYNGKLNIANSLNRTSRTAKVTIMQ